jgi:hypothetical protein
MSAWAWAVLAIVGGLFVLAGSDLVSEELRGWLDLAPRAVLRLAAVQLRAGQRKKILEEVWIPDLMYVLRGKESRPITRLIRGMWFAVGLLISVLRGRYSYQPGSNTKVPPATNEDVKQARESWQSSGMATPTSGSWRLRAKGSTPSQSVNMLPGESLVLTVRKHPVILLRPIVLTLTGLTIAALLSVSGLNGIGIVLDAIWIAWGVLLLILAWRITGWSVEYLVLTSRRIILATGILSRKTESIPIARMTSITLRRSIPGRMIGYGELIVAAGGNEQSARTVP